VCVCVVLTLSCHDGPKSDVDERCVWSDVTFSPPPLSLSVCVCVCEGGGQGCYTLPFLGIEKRRCVQHSLYPSQVPSPPRPPLLLSRRLVPLPHQVRTCMGAWVQGTWVEHGGRSLAIDHRRCEQHSFYRSQVPSPLPHQVRKDVCVWGGGGARGFVYVSVTLCLPLFLTNLALGKFLNLCFCCWVW